MKPTLNFTTCLALAALASPGLRAQEEPSPEIAGLQQAAADFVIAYNNKDAGAIAALFTENGEMTNLTADESTTGRADIKTHYEEVFAEKDVPEAAVEVASVRLVAPNVAIEDGTVHLDPPGDDTPVRSTAYTAVLTKNASGVWQIASTRNLKDVTDAGGNLADLADDLKGDWTCQRDGMRMDFAFGWDNTGKYLVGQMLTTSDDAEPQTTSIRIGWDGARKTISWWTFDSAGGFAKGDWTADDDGWILRNEGTSSTGEFTSANGHLTIEGKDAMIWTSKDRIVDGEKIPNVEMRIVRQAPEPELEPAASSNEPSEPADQ
ncbi:MAG: nuclear transport factor 2 family protein [Luteolibacter sp.]|uniref:YybH family protein n=1 Tax=Luteolibacter sp. TaxID=1962973 RepID=UPI0032655573